MNIMSKIESTSFGHIIDGVKVEVRSRHEVRNPATGEVVGQMPLGTKSDIDAAVAAARHAFKRWSRVSDDVRKLACKQIADRLGEKIEELARLLTLEQGKPLQGLGSRWEIGGTQAWTACTGALEIPVKVLQDSNEGRVELHRKPIGVVGSIVPWNFPVLIASWHVIPAIRASVRRDQTVRYRGRVRRGGSTPEHERPDDYCVGGGDRPSRDRAAHQIGPRRRLRT
jgi:acyl-CoA reductase-like NAD-dependent aldehyde dehydrogenase